MDYLIVVHLDPASLRQAHVNHQLGVLGLSSITPDSGFESLPDGTLVGVRSGSSARALRRRVQAEVRMAVGSRVRATVCVGRHPSMHSMVAGPSVRLAA